MLVKCSPVKAEVDIFVRTITATQQYQQTFSCYNLLILNT